MWVTAVTCCLKCEVIKCQCIYKEHNMTPCWKLCRTYTLLCNFVLNYTIILVKRFKVAMVEWIPSNQKESIRSTVHRTCSSFIRSVSIDFQSAVNSSFASWDHLEWKVSSLTRCKRRSRRLLRAIYRGNALHDTMYDIKWIKFCNSSVKFPCNCNSLAEPKICVSRCLTMSAQSQMRTTNCCHASTNVMDFQ